VGANAGEAAGGRIMGRKRPGFSGERDHRFCKVQTKGI
jgi:hypothetical protein